MTLAICCTVYTRVQESGVVSRKIFQEETTGSSLLCSRNGGGIFQNIRFALMCLEELAEEFILVSPIISVV